jgi:hypothetical protein
MSGASGLLQTLPCWLYPAGHGPSPHAPNQRAAARTPDSASKAWSLNDCLTTNLLKAMTASSDSANWRAGGL